MTNKWKEYDEKAKKYRQEKDQALARFEKLCESLATWGWQADCAQSIEDTLPSPLADLVDDAKRDATADRLNQICDGYNEEE